jgi:hypothetical protein
MFKETVDRRYGGGSVADREGDPLGSPAAAVAGGEHTWKTGLAHEWQSWRLPAGMLRNRPAREKKPLAVLSG